jgi:hypothetical protein
MNTFLHRSIWFSRVVLGAATLLLVRISVGYIVDPVRAVAPHAITLGSAEAITMMRVSGGVFLGIAIAVGACLVAERRMLVGLGFLFTVAATILAVRLVGLAIDGPAPFTLRVLKPEVALVVLSGMAFALDRKRRSMPVAESMEQTHGSAFSTGSEHAR